MHPPSMCSWLYCTDDKLNCGDSKVEKLDYDGETVCFTEREKEGDEYVSIWKVGQKKAQTVRIKQRGKFRREIIPAYHKIRYIGYKCKTTMWLRADTSLRTSI